MPAPTQLHNTLREAGRRLTGQRQLLLEVLQEHGGHLDAHELYRLARERDPHLNLSTVYRTLGLLHDLGLVDEQHLGEEHHHYELRTTSTHYHLVCGACGAVVEFASPLVEALKAAVAQEHDYTIADAQVELLGLCAACRAAAAEQPSASDSEHKASTRDRVVNLLRRSLHPFEDPPAAGQPEPLRQAELSTVLHGLPTGSSGQVMALTGGHHLVARLAALGLTPGATFEVAQNPSHGPVIVLVRDTRLVLGRGEAAHVLVTPLEARNGWQSN